MLVDFFWPRECFVCGVEGTNLCPSCQKSLPCARFKCLRCGAKNTLGLYCRDCRWKSLPEKVLACFAYEGNLKDAIRLFKYDDTTDLASTFGRALSKVIKSIPDFKKFTLVPIPVSPKKLRTRGYNQAELLAEAVAERLNLEVCRPLARSARAESQVEAATKDARAQNIKGVFKIDKTKKVPDDIILIDDVVTTGATVEEACKVLKRHGAKKVIVVALAM